MTALTQPALWTRARASYGRAVRAIGAPATIAAIPQLTCALRRTIVGLLFRLEHVVRKLLLAEAAQLSPSWTAGLPARISARIAEKCAPGGARSNLDPSQPETWSARFSFALPRDPLAVPEARAPRIRALWADAPASPPPLHTPRAEREPDSTFRLARRFEALRRVLKDPIPHAERLARVLARAVRRFPEIVHRFAAAPSRTGDYDRADDRLTIDAMGRSLDAVAAFSDSS